MEKQYSLLFSEKEQVFTLIDIGGKRQRGCVEVFKQISKIETEIFLLYVKHLRDDRKLTNYFVNSCAIKVHSFMSLLDGQGLTISRPTKKQRA